VRKQFVRGRRETSRLTRTAPIAFGDTSIYANRRRSTSACLPGERRIWDQRVQTWKEVVRGGRYNDGTQLPVSALAVRSVRRAFSLLRRTVKRREASLFLRNKPRREWLLCYTRSENALAQAPLASKGACDQPRTRRLGETEIQWINQLGLCSFCRLINAEILSRRCENIELVSFVPLTADSSVEISLSRALYSGSSLM
jgi:hypothetical protein